VSYTGSYRKSTDPAFETTGKRWIGYQGIQTCSSAICYLLLLRISNKAGTHDSCYGRMGFRGNGEVRFKKKELIIFAYKKEYQLFRSVLFF
jgi:hypothetical protein